ncbi:MAG TPA: hypothetical protein VH914_20555 [Acidimicrobiia bacterium]|nr:hypothetical protein [Acidimicrobiia bacterium]
MAKRTKMPTGVQPPPMPAYGQPMLRLQRDAPGARWARLALRVVVVGGLVAMTIELVARLVH